MGERYATKPISYAAENTTTDNRHPYYSNDYLEFQNI